jgi:hypothetical protein
VDPELRWFVVAAILVLVVGFVVSYIFGVVLPVGFGGPRFGPWPEVLGISGALFILSAGLIRAARR